jgi:hypothetical protein
MGIVILFLYVCSGENNNAVSFLRLVFVNPSITEIEGSLMLGMFRGLKKESLSFLAAILRLNNKLFYSVSLNIWLIYPLAIIILFASFVV